MRRQFRGRVHEYKLVVVTGGFGLGGVADVSGGGDVGGTGCGVHSGVREVAGK